VSGTTAAEAYREGSKSSVHTANLCFRASGVLIDKRNMAEDSQWKLFACGLVQQSQFLSASA
jgi:hypothetical protein